MNNIAQSFYQWYSNTLRNTKYRWLIILGTLLYLFSPIDIAPDFIPIIGWIDDGVVATLLVAEVSQMMLEVLNRQQRNMGNKAASTIDGDVIDVQAQ
jgi:uncharacterized membrane protein YkvA (DUF1232 family)